MAQLFSSIKEVTIPTTSQGLSHSLIFIGPAQSGKSTLVSKLSSHSLQDQSGLIYSYFKTNIAGYQTNIQTYEVSGTAFKDLLTLPLSSSNYNKLTYVLVFDLTDNPQQLLTDVDRELTHLKEQQESKLQTILTPELFQEHENSIYQRVEQHQDRTRIRPQFIPVVIVGWKYDEFAKQLDIESRKWISRGLRYLAHTNNCSLAFGSHTDFSLVKSLIFNEIQHSSPSAITDHLKPIGVTRSADTMESINVPTGGNNPLEAFNKIIKDQTSVNPPKAQKVAKNHISEEDWQIYQEDRIDRLLKQNQFQQNQKHNDEHILF